MRSICERSCQIIWLSSVSLALFAMDEAAAQTARMLTPVAIQPKLQPIRSGIREKSFRNPTPVTPPIVIPVRHVRISPAQLGRPTRQPQPPKKVIPELPPPRVVEKAPQQQPNILTKPTSHEFFRLESEQSLRARLQKVAAEKKIRFHFPSDKIELTEKPRRIRQWPLAMEIVEPAFNGYRRLWFQQINSERYGWDLGIFQPILSTGKFYSDIVLAPVRLLTPPYSRVEYNAGYCMPGDNAPFLLYPIHKH